MTQAAFRFHPDVRNLGVDGMFFSVLNVANTPSDYPPVAAFVEQCLKQVPGDMEKSKTLAGFHELHTRVSVKPEKLVSAPENLLSYYRSRKDIPRINGVVDLYNAISLRSGLAIGAHDLSHVTGDIDLRLTDGGENFWPLGAKKLQPIPAGKYAYIDGNNDILCRLEVRQVEKTKVTTETRDVFFIVQGNHYTPPEYVKNTGMELCEKILELFGGYAEHLYLPENKTQEMKT